MADGGTLRVRVVADTSQFERDMQRVSERVERTEARAEESAARRRRAFSSLGLGAVSLGGAALQNRGIQQAILSGRQGASAAARTARQAGTALRVVSAIVPQLRTIGLVLGGLGLARFAFGRRGSSRGQGEELQKQTQILQALLLEARAANVSTARLQARRAAAADPFDPSINRQTERMRLAGTLSTAREERRLGQLAISERRLAEAREANQRINASLTAPFRTAFNNLRAGANNLGTSFTRGFVGGSDAIQGLSPGNTFTGTIGQRLGDLLAAWVAPFGAGSEDAGREAIFGTGADGNPLTSGALGGPLQRQLARLQRRGPGQITGAAPTVRAGEVSEYQFLVQRQTEQQNRENTLRWQREVLSVLQQMRDNAISGVDDDTVWRQKLAMGIEGVD